MDMASERVVRMAEVFEKNQTQPFPVLIRALREQVTAFSRNLSRSMHKHTSYVKQVEAGRFLMCEKDLELYAEILGVNDGFARQLTQRWQANYEVGIKKVFAEHHFDPLPVLFHLIRGTIGIAASKMSQLLGKHASFIDQFEKKKHMYFPQECASESVKIFRLDEDQSAIFMAKWEKSYKIPWGRGEQYQKLKRVAKTKEPPSSATAIPVSVEALEDFFLDHGEEPFQIFFKGLRILLGISADSLTRFLGLRKGFVDRFEGLKVFLPEDLAKKCAKIFKLGEGHAVEFLDKWEDYSEKHGPPSPPKPTATTLLEKTAIATSRKEIYNSPLVRFVSYLCVKAGIDMGLAYLDRNGEVEISNLGPDVDNCVRLKEIFKLAKKLRLGQKEIHELSAVLFAVYPGRYKVEIKAEDNGMEFLDLAIGLAVKGADIKICET